MRSNAHSLPRTCSPATRQRALLAVAVLLLSGCSTKGLRFVNTAVPPLPSVLAASDGHFLLHAQVLNNTDKAAAAGTLKIDIVAKYTTKHQSLCERDFVQNNVYMAPGGKWTIQDFAFGAGTYSGDPCVCSNGFACTGFVTIKLRNTSTGAMLDGPRTFMSMKFKPPGTFPELTVDDLSD
jgi:hypothetical protein